MSAAFDAYDQWLRHGFVAFNTELEEAYFAARSEILHGDPRLEKIKHALMVDGATLIAQIDADEIISGDARERYQLLGAVGFFLGACRRHELDRPDSAGIDLLSSAWSLAHRLGASLGVAPRFVFAHQSLYNPAVGDSYRTFTSLPDETTFTTNNALAVLAYQRTAAALRRVGPMGVSSPIATYLFQEAQTGLADVLRFDRILSDQLDVDRFFFNVRPYFKPHRVGTMEYRGANAGDFAAVNEIDLLLGLCTADDPFYQNLLAEKYAYVPPEDQILLRTAVTTEPLLAHFLREAQAGPVTPQLRLNAGLFLAICRSHGAAYAFHHHRLVKPFLEEPARNVPPDHLDGITASGPPLAAVIRGLARLSDLRAARDRPDVFTARTSLNRLGDLMASNS